MIIINRSGRGTSNDNGSTALPSLTEIVSALLITTIILILLPYIIYKPDSAVIGSGSTIKDATNAIIRFVKEMKNLQYPVNYIFSAALIGKTMHDRIKSIFDNESTNNISDILNIGIGIALLIVATIAMMIK